MTSVSPLQSVSLASTSLINGASNNVTFTVNSPSDLINGNILSITFPSQMALPTTLVWVGITNLAPSLTCSNTGQKVDISLIFSADIILLAGNSISVTVQNITNPTTTSPSDDFILLIKNVNGFLINDYPNALKLTTTQPGIITNASLSQSSKNASANVNINITIQLVHNVPIGGMISIIHPSGVSVTAGTLSASLISPTVTSALTVSYTSTDRTIKITDMFPAGASAGDIYEFQLVNIKNTATTTLTSSFDITTFVSSVGAYRIDQVKSGLTMIAD